MSSDHLPTGEQPNSDRQPASAVTGAAVDDVAADAEVLFVGPQRVVAGPLAAVTRAVHAEGALHPEVSAPVEALDRAFEAACQQDAGGFDPASLAVDDARVQDLLAETWDSRADAIASAVTQFWLSVDSRTELDPTADPRSELEALAAAATDVVADSPWLRRLAFDADGPEAAGSHERAAPAGVVSQLEEFFEQCLHTGRLATVDEAELVDVAVTILREGVASYDQLADPERALKRRLRLAFDSLVIPSADPNQTYYDTVADDYDEIYTDGLSQAEDQIAAAELAGRVEDGDRVLDLGCGSGLGYELLCERGLDVEYVGVDISAGMIHEARAKHGDEATFHVADIANLPTLESASFDSVISLWGSFSHAFPSTRAIDEVDRLLAPGGTFTVLLYSRWSVGNVLDAVRERSITPLERVRPYTIRQTDSEVTSQARFYSAASATEAFDAFTDVSVTGVNAFVESTPLATLFRSPERSEAAKRVLRAEQALLETLGAVDAAHTLFVSGREPVAGDD